MKGRAGRFGQGLIGESIIMCKNTHEFKRVRELIMEIPSKLTSCLATSEKAMSQVVLEAIANRMADSEDSLKLYLQFTFYGHQSITNNGSVIESALTALKFLLENEFLVKNNESISPTSLGSATLISSLKPEEALFVYHELIRAMKNLVLINELHLIYLVTAPNTGQLNPNWAFFFELAQSFQSDVQLVADAVGINLAYISQLSRGFDQSQKSNRWQIHARFFQALIIYELVKEKSLSSISMKYDINRGTLQTIQNQSATFCGMVRTFAIQMKWEHYNQLFSLIQDRVTFGVEQELLQLSKIAGMNRLRARAFYEKGLRKPSDIANVQVSLIFEILAKVMKDSTKLNILKEARKISQEAKDFAF
jgi:replicative superfamily II helicase